MSAHTTTHGISKRARASTVTAQLRRFLAPNNSNFVNYPIVLDGERVNTTEAVWAKDTAEITKEEECAHTTLAAAPAQPAAGIVPRGRIWR